MTVNEIKSLIQTEPYDFLRTNPHLGDNIILLGLGGSHAYGTNTDTSDVDIRGIAVNSKEEILTGQNFEQVTDTPTDTTIYSLSKIIKLLSNCNPNTIEMLGLEPWQYLHIAPAGQQILDNRKIFLSKKAVQSFGGYANSQLRRLSNKSNEFVSQAKQEEHILHSIENAKYTFVDKYFEHDSDSIKLYIDDAINPEMEKEIFMDINLTHYPLRDYKGMYSEMSNIIKDYASIGKRNKNATIHDKINKHAMHLIRLYIMAIDILEQQAIITYRQNEHDLLMDIRNGRYFDDNSQPTADFNELLNKLEARFEKAKSITTLPDVPDYAAINKLLMSINEQVVKG